MPLPLEKLSDGSPHERNFNRLAALVPDFGGRGVSLRFGTGTLVFTASQDSANATITHGLGKTPLAVLAVAAAAPNFTDIPTFNAHTFGATTFGMNGRKWAASTVNVNFYWLAIG